MNSGAPDPDTLNSEVADPTIPSLGALDPAVLASAMPDPFVSGPPSTPHHVVEVNLPWGEQASAVPFHPILGC
uniref:Uncharacterized protein n=1 Tax=Oryza glumipatula TaxID=40148 RepID=A0A0D9ZIG9_9ORYZ